MLEIDGSSFLNVNIFFSEIWGNYQLSKHMVQIPS